MPRGNQPAIIPGALYVSPSQNRGYLGTHRWSLIYTVDPVTNGGSPTRELHPEEEFPPDLTMIWAPENTMKQISIFKRVVTIITRVAG